MKNICIMLCMISLTLGLSAQELATSSSTLTSKKGIPILPEKGDYAIGVGAYPFLYYMGNMFNNTEDNELDLYESTLYGRYFLEDDVAIQAALYINNTKNTYKQYVPDDAARANNALSLAEVVDQQIYNSKGHSLDLSYLKFRGYGRLRGYYGVAAGYSRYRSSYEYTYGNNMTVTNPNPTTFDFGYYGETRMSNRPLYQDNGISQSLRAGVVAGVELYFMPKTCIGFDLTLAYSYNWYSQADTKNEQWDGSQAVEIVSPTSPGNRYSNFDTYLPAFGDLYLMFHF